MSESQSPSQPGEQSNDRLGNRALGEENDDEDREMKRVNITISETQHDRLKKFAKEQGMTFSGLARRGAEVFRRQQQNDGIQRSLQPLLQTLESQGEELEHQSSQIETLIQTLDKLNQSSEATAADDTVADDTIAIELRKVLKKYNALSITDLIEKSEFNRKEVQRGINTLRDSYSVQRIESETGQTKWEAI